MIIHNRQRDTRLGSGIELAGNAVQRLRGLLGRDGLADGGGMLFNNCSSIHTFFMHFPIDIIFLDKKRKVLKVAHGVKPFKLVASPFRAHYALELPAGTIAASNTRVGDHLDFVEVEAEAAA